MRNLIVSSGVVMCLLGLPAQADWKEATAALEAGDYAAAVVGFQEAVDQHPDRYEGHYMLGMALRGLKRQGEAVDHLRKAYDLNPNDIRLTMHLGVSYHEAGRHAEAAKLLQGVASGQIDQLDERLKGSFYVRRAKELEESGSEHESLEDYLEAGLIGVRQANAAYKEQSTPEAAAELAAAQQWMDEQELRSILYMQHLGAQLERELKELSGEAGRFDFLTDRWIGSYTCQGVPIAMKLMLLGSDDGKVEGEFNFGPTDESAGVPKGTFSISGRFVEESGVITLEPREWLIQPPGFGMVGLTGIVDGERTRIDGKIDFESCGTFTVRPSS